jgi:hypothetical protein
MEHDFFSLLKGCGAEGYYTQPFALARQFDIETRHVRERLVGWAREGLISLDVYTENGFRPFSDWQSADDFFECGNRAGHVRVKLLAAGDEYLELLHEVEHRPIGFQANVG